VSTPPDQVDRADQLVLKREYDFLKGLPCLCSFSFVFVYLEVPPEVFLLALSIFIHLPAAHLADEVVESSESASLSLLPIPLSICCKNTIYTPYYTE
jgi:hypothetical protein